MGVTQNSYIPRAWEVSDLKVSCATRPRPLNQILLSHLVYNYYIKDQQNLPQVRSQTGVNHSACYLIGTEFLFCLARGVVTGRAYCVSRLKLCGHRQGILCLQIACGAERN